MGTLEFNLGEKKYVSATVRTNDENDIVIINEAKWELYETSKSEPITGTCSVSGDEVSALIEANKKGTYILKFIITIGPETIIEKTSLRVS